MIRIGVVQPARSQPRSAGNSEIASPPAATSSHSSSGLATPPGNRQPIPTITTGSHRRDRRGTGTGTAGASRGPAVAEQLGPHEPGQRHRGRVVEDQRGGQPQPGRGVQPVAQLDRGQ